MAAIVRTDAPPEAAPAVRLHTVSEAAEAAASLERTFDEVAEAAVRLPLVRPLREDRAGFRVSVLGQKSQSGCQVLRPLAFEVDGTPPAAAIPFPKAVFGRRRDPTAAVPPPGAVA